MYRHTQNTNYTNYYYLPPLSSTNTYNQYYEPHLRTQPSYYSNTTLFPTYTLPTLQYQYQLSTTIPDTTQPISVFDDLKLSRYHQSNTTTFPLAYLPSPLNRRSSVNDARLATASAIREQLLIDIQRNITEIDRELTSLEQRPSIPPTPLTQHRFSTFLQARQTSIPQNTLPSNDNNRIWSNKPKRVYSVIPQITSASQKTSQQSTPKLIHQTSTKHSFVGRFHYSSEVEDNEILENDPENSDRRSIIFDIPDSSSHKIFSPNDFIREQSPLPQNRALTFVPEYADNNDIEINQSTEDIHQNNPIDTTTARSSRASSLHEFGASNKLNIQDFQALTQAASQSPVKTTSKNKGDHHKSAGKVEQDLANTMLSKPVKHSHVSTRTHQAATEPEHNLTDDSRYFFSDYGNEGEGEEDVVPNDPNHFALPTDSERISDENISVEQSQTSQQQQLPIENNNVHVQERVTVTITSPSKKIVPISIMNNMQTPFSRNYSDDDQRQISPPMLNQNTNEQSAENRSNTFAVHLHSSSLISERRPTSVNEKSHLVRQRSSSSRRSSKSSPSNILLRDRSISSTDISKTPTNQSEHFIDNNNE